LVGEVRVSVIMRARSRVVWISSILRQAFVRGGYFVSSAIFIPYCIWVYVVEPRSFSRIPVTFGVLLLGVVTFILYFSTTLRFRLRFSWRKTLVAALLFAITGVGFVGILSVIFVSYLCEALAYGVARRGLPRPSFSPNLGVVLVVVQALVVFPLLSELYFRGAEVRIWHPDYNKENLFYAVNRDGFRGPRVPLERSHTPRFLFLGDSSPFGWPYRYEESFPFIVQAILKARGIDIEIINAATIGQSDGEIREQLPYLLKYRPDLVFLMTGIHYLRAAEDYQRIEKEGVSRDTRWHPHLIVPPMLAELLAFAIVTSPIFHKSSDDNVAAHQRELESFKTQLRAVVQQVRASGARLYLVDYPTPGAPRQVQDEIRRVAEETGTDYIPLFELIGKQIQRHLHDTIHPDPEGHRLIAQEIAKTAVDALSDSGHGVRPPRLPPRSSR
jgi:lysophospholipase L1-like esterase